MSLQIVEETENRLLRRREITCLLKGLAGRLTRWQLVRAVAEQLKVEPEKVQLIKMLSSTGSRDIRARLYIFERLEDARRQLPEHFFKRVKPQQEQSEKGGEEG